MMSKREGKAEARKNLRAALLIASAACLEGTSRGVRQAEGGLSNQ